MRLVELSPEMIQAGVDVMQRPGLSPADGRNPERIVADVYRAMRRLDSAADGIDRVEAKLDVLVSALVEDEADEPETSLDGSVVVRGRDQSQSL